jgi:hypothetical protein
LNIVEIYPKLKMTPEEDDVVALKSEIGLDTVSEEFDEI